MKNDYDIKMHLKDESPIRFDQFMQLALYHPKWGYYNQKTIFGAKGDFITAPELTPLFGQTLAKALSCSIKNGLSHIYEFGAGQGSLALQILGHLGAEIEQYTIIEVSAQLKEKQQTCLREQLPAAFFNKAVWSSALPDKLKGIVIGNEVLDAMPVRRLRRHKKRTEEAWVETNNDGLCHFTYRPCVEAELINHIQHTEGTFGPWPDDYETEHAEQANAFVRTITEKLEGLCLMIDYGMSAQEYFQPKHKQGHLRAHFRHTAHDDFLVRPGEQDLTCHANYTGILNALEEQGGQLEGYVSQSAFLLHHGLLEQAQKLPDFTDPEKGLKTRQAINSLVSESDMGLNFKVMAWSKNHVVKNPSLTDGFVKFDSSYRL